MCGKGWFGVAASLFPQVVSVGGTLISFRVELVAKGKWSMAIHTWIHVKTLPAPTTKKDNQSTHSLLDEEETTQPELGPKTNFNGRILLRQPRLPS